MTAPFSKGAFRPVDSLCRWGKPPLPKGGGPPTDYYFNIKIIISEKGGGGIHEVEKIKLFMLSRCAYNMHFSNFTNG